MAANKQETDRLQRIVAKTIATSPAGVNLLLIGGFRFRLLDQSQRFSADIDYHWGGDLDAKQGELLQLCRRSILTQVRRELDYEGSASIRKGPEADAPNARFLDLRFWKKGASFEVPIEITRILCLDPPIIRTVEGTVHATPSDADVIESKLIAIVNRLFIQHRDLVDLFLYADKLRPDSRIRLEKKIKKLGLSRESITRRLRDLEENQDYHSGSIQKVLIEQMDSVVAQQMDAGGGGKAVLSATLELLQKHYPS